MADQRVNIKVTTQGAGKSKKDLGGLNKSITSLGRSVLNTSVAYFGATGLIRGLMKSAELAGIQEQAEKRLEVALGRTSNALLKQASSLQKMTVFGDESIIGVQASIGAFIKSEDQIKKATEATLDIAVAMGMDLKSAGDLVAKTLGSSTNAMSRYGIEVSGAVGSTERLESLTGNVARLFGGQAKAQTETYAGSVEQLKNEFGDMAENIGTIVIPVFETLAPHLKTAIKFWQEYLNVGEKTSEQTSKYDVEIQSLTDSIKFQQEAIQGLGATNFDLNGSTERHNQLRRRAFDQGRTLIEQMKHELEMISELIKKKEELENSRKEEIKSKNKVTDVNKGLAKSINEQSKKTAEATTLEKERFDTSFSAIRSTIKAYLAQAIASAVKDEIVTKGGFAGIVTGTLVAVGVSELFDEVVPKFAQGGIVQGDPSKGDTVPVMATAGELILNQAQQENLVANNGITINISAPLVDETVVDSIIPAIERAKSLGTA